MAEYTKIRLTPSEKISLISNLSTMINAGIPILEAVHSIMEDAKGGPKKILDVLAEDLSQGKQIYLSFDKFPNVFDKVTVNVIKASEEAGTLDVTLKDLKRSIREQMEFNDKIKSALLYPAFILTVFVGILILNLVFVIPKIATVFKNLKVPLPLPTRVLIFISDLMLDNTYYFLGGLVLVILLVYILVRTKRNLILNIFYSLPLVSELVKLIDLTRFSRSLFLLLSSGLPITEALELTEDVVVRIETSRVIKTSKEMIISGKNLSQGLRFSKGYIPTMMIKIVEAGEKTGTLDKSMQDVSEYFDYQVSNMLKTMTALLEPIMLVLVGIVVGGMMLSIIAPIYGLISQVGGL